MNNDLISREALKKWVDDSISQYGNQYSTDMLNMFGLFKEVIDNAPTVEVDDLKNAIKTIRDICKDNNTCNTCPMNCNCNEQPAKWII